MFHDPQNKLKYQNVLNPLGWPNEQRFMFQLECDMCSKGQCDDNVLGGMHHNGVKKKIFHSEEVQASVQKNGKTELNIFPDLCLKNQNE